MTIELNHTIIPATDKWRSAKFLADILGLEVGPEWSHFAPIRTGNGVTLDYADASEFRRGHYAFLLSENEFDGLERGGTEDDGAARLVNDAVALLAAYMTSPR